MKLVIFRHGETDANKSGNFQGITDNPLNETGINQAKALRESLIKRNIFPDIIFTSPLIRAARTAELVAQGECEIIPIKDLHEITITKFEGVHKVEFFNKYKTLFGTPNDSTLPNFMTSRVPEGESRTEAAERWKKSLNFIKNNYPEYQTVGIATHGGLMGVIYYSLFNNSSKYIFENCEYFIADI